MNPDSLSLRLLIIDDEPLARERARRLLERLGGVEVVGECANGGEALREIEGNPPDVLLLDINMPEVDGLRLIEALDDPPAVILATAHEEYAVRAFDLEVADYLLKPYSAERLGRALERVRRRLLDGNGVDVTPTPGRRIPADSGRTVELLPPECICAARIEETVVFLLRDDGERLCFAGTLQELEEKLPGDLFLRASRQSLVNLHAVERYQSMEDGSLRLDLHGGHTEHVSRRRARFFRARLG